MTKIPIDKYGAFAEVCFEELSRTSSDLTIIDANAAIPGGPFCVISDKSCPTYFDTAANASSLAVFVPSYTRMVVDGTSADLVANAYAATALVVNETPIVTVVRSLPAFFVACGALPCHVWVGSLALERPCQSLPDTLYIDRARIDSDLPPKFLVLLARLFDDDNMLLESPTSSDVIECYIHTVSKHAIMLFQYIHSLAMLLLTAVPNGYSLPQMLCAAMFVYINLVESRVVIPNTIRQDMLKLVPVGFAAITRPLVEYAVKFHIKKVAWVPYISAAGNVSHFDITSNEAITSIMVSVASAAR